MDQARASVPDLLAAVRRRLWLAGLVDALRLSLWLAAAGLLLSAAVHALLRPVPPQAVAWGLLAIVGACLVRAAWRRPDDRACALWADRHLHGQNAFSTWLDMRRDRPAGTDPRAVQWLDEWTAVRSGTAQARLASHRWPGRLARPALTLALSAGLCAVVLSLVDRPASGGSAAQTAPAAAAPASSAMTVTSASPQPLQQLAGELERALRSPARDDTPGRQATGARGTAAAGGAAGAAASAAEDTPGRTAGPPDKDPVSDPARAHTSASQQADPVAAQSAAGPGTGRGAGDSSDDAGTAARRSASRGAGGPVRGVDIASRPATPQRQADMAQGATYDESQGLAKASAGALPAALPAQAPAAGPDAPMTPTETHYVQAWMKAITRPSR